MGKSTPSNSSLENAQVADANALTSIAQTQSANSQAEFNASFPGFQSAENFYGTLSTGDPYAISQAMAPATQQISQATQGAKQNIMNNSPNGGEKNLAIEQADVSQGAQVGGQASQGYLNSFNALAQLAGQGVGASTSSAGTAISGYNSAASTSGSVVSENTAAKGAQLGALSSLGSDAATIGAAGITSGAFI